MPEEFWRSFGLLLALLNPFLVSLYLVDLIRSLGTGLFAKILFRAGLIAGSVFIFFAWSGDQLFSEWLQVRFASFLIFGGLVFLIIGLRFMFLGPKAIEQLRGEPEHLAGSIAMPFLIGPGTVSASILTGQRLSFPLAVLAIALSMALMILGLVLLKVLHDWVQQTNEALVERYVDIMGRISALLLGTFAVEMVAQGVLEILNQS